MVDKLKWNKEYVFEGKKFFDWRNAGKNEENVLNVCVDLLTNHYFFDVLL